MYIIVVTMCHDGHGINCDYVTFGDYICKSGGLIDSSPALGVVYKCQYGSPW